MITVRFASGQSLQYNSGAQCTHDTFGTSIWNDTDHARRSLLAIVQDSAGAVIEWSQPCRVYNALQDQPLSDLTKEVRSLRRSIASRRPIKGGKGRGK